MKEQKKMTAEKDLYEASGLEDVREKGNRYTEEKGDARERRFFTAAFTAVIAAIIIWIYIGMKML